MSFPRKKRKTSPKLNVSNIERKAIMLTTIIKRGNKNQKTNIALITFTSVTVAKKKYLRMLRIIRI